MIKFFRRIRQQLLTQNNFSKYLLYAIGEIILVVIGILIALQINNWNEGRKSEIEKHKLMLDLKQEFSTNKETLEFYLTGLQKNNSRLNKVVNFSAGNLDLPIDSIRLYASNLVYPLTLSILNSVQEGAVSSGKFDILSDSLKHRLSLLKDYTKSREDISDKLTELTINNNREDTDLLLSLSAFPEVPEALYVQQPTAMHPDFVKSDDELVSLIRSSKTYPKLFQIYYFNISNEIWVRHGLLKQTDMTIDLIERELNEK